MFNNRLENLLPGVNLLHLHNDGLPGIRELTHQGGHVILPLAVIWIRLFVAEQIPPLIDVEDLLHLGGGWPLLEDVLHPLFHGGRGHLHVVLQEEGEAVQFASALHFLLGDDHHQGEPEALQGGHLHLVVGPVHQFGDLFVPILVRLLLAGAGHHFRSLEGQVLPILDHLVLAR